MNFHNLRLHRTLSACPGARRPLGSLTLALSVAIALASAGLGSLPAHAQPGFGLDQFLAQNQDQNQDQDQPVVVEAPPLERAQELMKTGAYAAAVDLFLRADGIDREAGVLGASQAYAGTGQYAAAIELLEDEIDDYAASAVLSTQLAELLRATGKSAEAIRVLAEVVEGNTTPPVRTLVQYGSVLQFVGRRDEAIAPLNAAIARYDSGLVFDAGEIAMVAVASWLLDRFHDANSLFSEATRIDPENLEAQVLWGDLFMEKYNVEDAEKSYNAALAINRRYAPALIGQAKISGGERSLQFALNVNSSDVAALETMGMLLLMNNRRDEALTYLEAALEVNPEALKALSLLAAQAALYERFAEFEELEARVAAFSPNNARFYGDIADVFGNNYRFTEAVAFATQALEADPNYWQGHTVMGSNLIRLGR